MKDHFLRIAVVMDAKSFSDFAFFDEVVLSGKWVKVLAFVIVIIVLAVINLFTNAALLFWVLLLLGILTPMAFYLQFRRSVFAQITRFQLETPKPVYSILLQKAAPTFQLHIEGQEPQEVSWNTLVGAYKTRAAVYLYTGAKRALLIPNSQVGDEGAELLWALVEEMVPANKIGVFTKWPHWVRK